MSDSLLGIDDVVVLNLPHRHDRRVAFWQGLPADWPLPAPRYIEARQGSDLILPPDWRSSPAAYGCAVTHLETLAAAIRQKARALLVLEDDAAFTDGFADQLATFADQVPADWQLLLLGGQHARTPKRVTAGCVRVRSSVRTHAYVVRRPTMTKLLRLWSHSRTHIDQSWLELQRLVPTYAPWPFLVGQRAGYSDITGKQEPERYWD